MHMATRHNYVGVVTSGQAPHNSSNVGVVIASQVGHNSAWMFIVTVYNKNVGEEHDLHHISGRGTEWNSFAW